MTKAPRPKEPRKVKASPKPPADAIWLDWRSLDETTKYDFGARLWGDPEGSTYSLRELRDELARETERALSALRTFGAALDDSPAPGHLVPLRRGLHALAERATLVVDNVQDQLTEYLRALVDLTDLVWEALRRGDLITRDARTGRRIAPPSGRPRQFITRRFLGQLPPDAAADAMRHAADMVARPPIFGAVDALRHGIADDAHWVGLYVARADFIAWAVGAGLSDLQALLDNRSLDDDARAIPAEPGKKIERRVDAIVDALKQVGLDPLALPKSDQRDLKSPKNVARKIVMQHQRGLFGESDAAARRAFDKAWDAARASRRIRNK